MNANEDNAFCKGCGETLTTFLREMAEQNAEVVCPHCGKVYTRNEAQAVAEASQDATKDSHRKDLGSGGPTSLRSF